MTQPHIPQHRSELALRKYERIVSATSDLISLLDRNYIYQMVNEAYLRAHNKHYEDIVGHSVSELLGEEVFESGVKENLDRSLVGETIHYQAWFEFASLGPRYTSVTYSPYLETDGRVSGVVVNVRDITEIKQAVEALKESEEKYRLIAETSADGIFSLNLDGRFVFSNDAHTRMLGDAPHDVIGSHFLNFVSQAELERGREIFRSIVAGKRVEGEILAHDKHGREFPLYFNAAPMISGDEVIGITGIARNIIDRKRAETVLKKAKETAEAANQTKNIFLANINHELRTPLNIILGNCQILRHRNECSPEIMEGLNVIFQSGNHLLTLINDLLDISKIGTQEIALIPHEMHFSRFLKKLAGITRIQAREKGIKFRYKPAQQLPVIIKADEKRLRQVLLNLLTNAVRFTNSGRVTFRVRSNRFRNKEGSDKSLTANIRFEVEDTGVGMRPDQLERIFLPFEQLRSADQWHPGTGAGLTISRHLVRLMGGDIRVNSEPGKGSAFWFEVMFRVVGGMFE